MPTGALLLALAAACLHAGWNLLLARAKDAESATAVALALAVLAFAPAAALAWDVRPEAGPYIAASAALELAYFALLAAAYRRAELGLVYPLSRGLAPVLVLAVAAAALGVEPSVTQVAGVLLIGAGVLLVRGLRGKAARRGTVFALAIAACIAGYTLVDKEGMRYADPIPYLELVLLGPAVAYPGLVAAVKGTRALRAELRPVTAVAALAMFGAYALVLAALELAPAAPVAALRETSVVIATALAVLVLREPLSAARLAGAVLVVAGIAVLATT